MSRRNQIDGPLAEALARGETLSRAAESAGCSLATAKRRWAEPEFRRRVIAVQEEGRRDRQARQHASWYYGVKLVYPALQALHDTLQDAQASHLDKARAARVLLRAFGPKEEPPEPRVLSVEDEQLQERQAAQVLRLLQQFPGNVVDLGARRPPAPPAGPPPPAGYPSMPMAAGAEHWPHEEELEEAEGGVMVGQESAESAPRPTPPAPGPPEQAALVVPEPPSEEAEEERLRALAWLRARPRRPPPGPDLVAWLEARKVVGLDPAADDRPRPQRRRRRRHA
jgi:hypothetical protein